MKLSDLMKNHTPDPAYEGWVTNDDYVLAVDISGADGAKDGEYVIVDQGITGLDAQMNPITQDKTYIRAGQSTTKTGTQRSFKVAGDRYAGDEFQDYALSHAIKFGVGNKVRVPYIYFCLLTGKGEKGAVSIIVNSDSAGNAGEASSIDIELKKLGAIPAEYTYAAPEAAS